MRNNMRWNMILKKLDVADHVQFRARFPWLSVMKRDEQYSDKEAQRRFLAAVKAGLNTKPYLRKYFTEVWLESR